MRRRPLCEEPDEDPEPAQMPSFDNSHSWVSSADDWPPSSMYWTREQPAAEDLVGWRMQVVYPLEDENGDGMDEESELTLTWVEGFVVSQQAMPGGQLALRIYFPADEFDDFFSLPDLDLAFHTVGASARVTKRQVNTALAAID